MKEIVERIRSLCKANNTSITKIEVELGYANGTIGKWANGKKNPPLEKVIAIANRLQATPEYILNGDQKEKPPVDDERFLPLAERREALSRAGIHIMLDADAKVTEEQLDDIISFIEIQQRRNGR